MEDCCGHYYQTKPGGETRGDWSLAVAWQLALNASLIGVIQKQAIQSEFHPFLAGNGSGVDLQPAGQCRVPQGMSHM